MPFEDFKRPWKIVESTASCPTKETVRIEGSEDAVTVRCGDVPYDLGKYFPKDADKGLGERIENDGEKGYKIFFIEKDPDTDKARIKASFKPGQIGGSWTAEDNAGTEDPG